MSEGIWIALLALIGTLVGSGSGVLIANKLVNYRLDQLEKKLDKNSDTQEKVIERVVVVEQSTKSAHHRLDDITAQLKITEHRKE